MRISDWSSDVCSSDLRSGSGGSVRVASGSWIGGRAICAAAGGPIPAGRRQRRAESRGVQYVIAWLARVFFPATFSRMRKKRYYAVVSSFDQAEQEGAPLRRATGRTTPPSAPHRARASRERRRGRRPVPGGERTRPAQERA